MFNSSQNSEQPEDNVSCYFSSYIDSNGELLFSCGWGEDPVDLKNFAILMHGMLSGENKEGIMQDIKQQCELSGDTEDFKQFQAFFEKLNSISNPSEDDIVVRPLSVNL